ncbi:MAG: type 4a pilus biogenesis protein PilO [Acidobacteriota bacterium]
MPKRTQFLLFGVLVAVAGYLFYSYLLSPRREALKVLDAEVQALTAEVQSGQMVEARLAQFRQEIALQRERLENLRQILPEEKETAEIIRRVQQLAVDSNLRIKSFTPQATVERDFYEDWPILISLEGDYDNLGRFFEKIGRFTRIINVDNINMKALPQPIAKRTLAATCTATTFVYLENKAKAL